MVFSKLLGSALGAFVAMSFSRFLGSEGRAIMLTGINLMLFGILIFSTIFLFRLFSFRFFKKDGFRLVFLYVSIFFLISLFGCFLRIFLVAHLGTFFNWALPFVILGVSGKERDIREIQFLTQVQQDLQRHGPNSVYINRILGR